MVRNLNKTLVFSAVICILLGLGIASYLNARTQTVKQLEKCYQDIATQEIRSLDRSVQEIERELHGISRNPVIQKTLQNQYATYLAANNDVAKFVETRFWYLTTSTSSGIEELEIISLTDIPKVGYFIYGRSRLEVHDWYKTLEDDSREFLYEKDGEAFLVYPIYKTQFLDTIGLIWVRLDIEYLRRPDLTADSVSGWELCLHGKSLATRGNAAAVTSEGVIGDNSMQVSAESSSTGFSIRYTVKKPAIWEGAFAMLILVVIAGIAILVLFLYYSKRLGRDYQAIMEEKKKQEYLQAMVLKAQISPHFLYNVMSMINWKAKYSGQEDISMICRELSDFYRTSLNKGREEITVRDELLNIESYLKLKQYLVEIPFTYRIEIDEELKDLYIIGFILQPIVENAIIHGIGQLERDGHIVIRIEKDGNDLLLKVRDNGKAGISNESFFANKSGYGVRNVHKRLRLKYGEDYGVFLNENCEETEVILRVGILPQTD